MLGSTALAQIPEVATVVGTGGFGAWAAILAARAGVKKLVLINPAGARPGAASHDVEEREIECGPFLRRHLGWSKVDALAELIGEFSSAVIESHKIPWDPDLHGDLLEGVVFAGPSGQRAFDGVWDESVKRGLPCYTGTYNGVEVGVFSSKPELKIIDAPVWIGSLAIPSFRGSVMGSRSGLAI